MTSHFALPVLPVPSQPVPRRVVKLLLLGLILGMSAFSLGADADGGNPALDGAFAALSKLELGQDLNQFQPIEAAIAQGRGDAGVRADLELRFAALLQGTATDLAKDYACRQLARMGSDACLPVVGTLLPNPRLAHMARYALEGIGSPAAAAQLREMLGRTEGAPQVGIVISLGRMADPDAAVPLASLLTSEHAELRDAVLMALGRIGTAAAGEALLNYAGHAAESSRSVLNNALLEAVESLCRRGDRALAVKLCESLQTAESELTRAAAWRALVAAKPDEAIGLILAGLAAEEPWKRAVAADVVVRLRTPEELAALTAAIADLPAAGQVAAFQSLQDRSEPSVRAAAWKSLSESEPAVCVAALGALRLSAVADDVPALVTLAASGADPAVREAAFETVRLMPATGTHAALRTLMEQESEQLPAVLRCALSRRAAVFVPGFIQAARSANAQTRLQAFAALEAMATAAEAPTLVDLLSKTAPGEEREAADRAVWMSCQQIPDPAARSALFTTALAQADAAGRCALLPTLARLGGTESLAAVHEAMQSQDQAARDAGYRALANWPDDSVAAELLEIAKTHAVDTYRIWALRAYARIVSLPSERPPLQTFDMLVGAMDLATRLEDKELIVARLGAVRVPEALARLLVYVDDPQLSRTAVPAVFTLAKGLSQSHPDQARAALEKIRPLTDDAAIRQQIPKVLRDIDARKQPQ